MISSHVNKMERHIGFSGYGSRRDTMPSYQQSGQRQGNQYGIVHRKVSISGNIRKGSDHADNSISLRECPWIA